jgi:mannose-1-phosphate guanylyltransferase
MISVILCGGAGSRLWPVSRELHPKPFLKLTDGQSLLQKAFLHGAGLAGLITLVMIEVQSGDYLGEDDITRFDDVYGRVQ